MQIFAQAQGKEIQTSAILSKRLMYYRGYMAADILRLPYDYSNFDKNEINEFIHKL